MSTRRSGRSRSQSRSRRDEGEAGSEPEPAPSPSPAELEEEEFEESQQADEVSGDGLAARAAGARRGAPTGVHVDAQVYSIGRCIRGSGDQY